jgi:hypothetical protein
VVDSADEKRLPLAAAELNGILIDSQLQVGASETLVALLVAH